MAAKGTSEAAYLEKAKSIRGYSAMELESLLRSHSNSPKELISNLFDSDGNGVLTNIIKSLIISSVSASNVNNDAESTAGGEDDSEVKLEPLRRPLIGTKTNKYIKPIRSPNRNHWVNIVKRDIKLRPSSSVKHHTFKF